MLASRLTTRGGVEPGLPLALEGEEAALLQQAEAGHTLAFERIAWRYDEAILGWLLLLSTSEQEALALYRATFMAAYQGLARRDIPSLYIWLHRLAAAHWLKRRRKQSDRRAPAGMLQQLSAHEQLVYTLKVGQKLAFRTVAQILDASEDSVATTFCRAVSKLQGGNPAIKK